MLLATDYAFNVMVRRSRSQTTIIKNAPIRWRNTDLRFADKDHLVCIDTGSENNYF